MVLEDKKACLFLTGRKDKNGRPPLNTSKTSMATVATVAMAVKKIAKGCSVNLPQLNVYSNLS